MADLKRTIEILFQGVDNVSTTVTSVGRSLDKLHGNVLNITSPFSQLTKGVLALDSALVAMAGAGITYSVNKYADFSDVMLKVKGIMDASESQFTQLTALTKDLGATTRYTASEAAQGLEFLAMAGVGFEDAMGALPQVLKLAQASATDLGTTADIVTNIMAGYGIEVKDLSSTTDVLTATFTNSNTNLTELGQAFKYVGPVAKSMGLEIEETGAILGKLADSGYKAEQGGTALRNILLALTAPMGNTAKLMKELGVDTEELGIDMAGSANALKSLGVNVKDATGNIRPFGDIMDDLKAGLDKIPGPADRAAILVEIFGKRGGPQMAALLSQGSEAVVGLESKIRSLGGVTNKIAAEMESGIGGALRSLLSAFESVALNAGERFSSGIIKPIKSVTDLLRTLSITIDEGLFDEVFDAFDDFGEELSEALDDIAENLPEALEGVDWDGFLDSLGGIGEAVRGMFEGVDWDAPQDLQRIIQAIVDSLETLTRFSTQIGEVFFTLAGYIGGLIDKFNSLDQETIATVGKITAIATAVSALATPVALVTTAIKGLGSVLTLVAANPIVATIVGIGAAIAGVAAVGIKASEAFAKWTSSNDEIEKSLSLLRSVDPALAGIIDLGAKAGKSLKDAFSPVENIDDDIARIYTEANKVGPAFNEATKSIKETNLAIVNATDMSDELIEHVKKLGLPVEFKVETEDVEKAVQKCQEIQVWREKTKQWDTIKIPVDMKDVEEVKKKIKEEIPAVKRLEIETDLKVAEIKSQTDIIESSLKFKASVNIAEIEAASKLAIKSAANISSMFEGTGNSISDLMKLFTGDTTIAQDNAIYRAIAEEQDYRKELLDEQKSLNKAQIEYMKARTDRLKSGDAIIKINGDGLSPHLEMIMWEVFEAIQIRATQEGLGYLNI